jgi:uncharacterized protein with von Willebrand factor type A (vWA) domain
MCEKVQNLDLVFLIDRSGSMYGSEEDTIGGFNSFIEKERKNEGNTNVTAILFDHEYEELYRRKPIDKVEKLTSDVYYVRGSTALLDAIGKTITTLDREIENKVLFVIMTDGMENSSVEFSKSQIKNMIENHKWEFIFIGADIDSYSEAGRIGIKSTHVANYRKSRRGVEDAYASVGRATRFMRKDMSLKDVNWKEDLEKYD